MHSERIAPNAASHIYRINPTTVVKTSDGVRMTEAASMRFVRENTSIPVPKVFDAFIEEESKRVCIVLEYIDGRRLTRSEILMVRHRKSELSSSTRISSRMVHKYSPKTE